MSEKRAYKPVDRIKTGSFERRLSLTKAGLFAGSRLAGSMAANLFSSKEKRSARRKKALSEQTRYLVAELGRLKGSVVKIGQMMALYGEHFLPEEVTEALHALEDSTTAMEWRVIEQVLRQELGEAKLAQLEVDPEPIGAASLGQVHRARCKASGEALCLKIQYPGVADAVDTDIKAVTQLLRMARLVSIGPDFNEWLEEVREMMHREVDYALELRTTQRFHDMLADDERYVVPRVLPEYSSPHVICSTYEPGLPITHSDVQQLPLARRNHLAMAGLDLFFKEMFEWGEFQTDPNFGNYRVRIGENGTPDQMVLLDFGAVQRYEDSLLEPVRSMIEGAYRRDLQQVLQGSLDLRFMRPEYPQRVLESFAEICMDVLEPLAAAEHPVPESSLNGEGEYAWRASDLPTRIAKRAAKAAFSTYFSIPPKEFVFLNRKLIGVYTFVSVLDAQFNGRGVLEPYLERYRAGLAANFGQKKAT